jgi:hypothetical protein
MTSELISRLVSIANRMDGVATEINEIEKAMKQFWFDVSAGAVSWRYGSENKCRRIYVGVVDVPLSEQSFPNRAVALPDVRVLLTKAVDQAERLLTKYKV